MLSKLHLSCNSGKKASSENLTKSILPFLYWQSHFRPIDGKFSPLQRTQQRKSFVSKVSYPSHHWHLCHFRCQREKALNSCYCKRKQKPTEGYSKLKCFINYLSKTITLSKKQIYITVNGEHLRKTKEKTWSVEISTKWPILHLVEDLLPWRSRFLPLFAGDVRYCSRNISCLLCARHPFKLLWRYGGGLAKMNCKQLDWGCYQLKVSVFRKYSFGLSILAFAITK